MALLAGYITYGTGGTPQAFVELTGGSYARSALTYSGNTSAGTLICSSATAPTSVGTFNCVAIFDAATGGNMTFWSPIPNAPVAYTSGSTIAAYSGAVAFNLDMVQSLASPGLEVFAQYFDFGSLNGSPLLAGTSLVLSGANTLIAGGGNIYVPTQTGVPTDVPGTVPNGFAAMRFDPTNNKIWFYTASATWKGVTVS